MNGEPYIPQFLTVHLGAPGSNAQNVTVSFPDYIKNVASSEIYPTWPENAIRANVYAQISYALNRYYTEWYRSMGYDFDITNSTRYDQAYVQNRDIFANISDIVDDIFNEYVYRQGSVEPYFTQYCNGTTVTCDGLSQWGTVPLAEQGYGPYDILVEFYGPDINLNTDTPVRINSPSYPGLPLRLGDAGNSVRTKQVQLNRISRNYPSIPKIAPVDGVLASLTASEGGMVSPSYAVAVIDGAEQMKVTVMVSEALVPKLAIGDTVTVRVSAADAEFEGVIRSVEKTANQVTKLYTVTVTVPAEVEGLLSGMFADVTFHTAVSESAVVVPSEAILTSSDKQYVFIVENDTAKRVDITTGLTGSGMTEVTSGLDAGARLVTVGQQYLSDGDAVRVVEG